MHISHQTLKNKSRWVKTVSENKPITKLEKSTKKYFIYSMQMEDLLNSI